MSKSNKFRRFAAALGAVILVVISVGCGKNPMAPPSEPPPTCGDPKATNQYGPPPCVYPPSEPPARSYSELGSTFPETGATLKAKTTGSDGYLHGDEVLAFVNYGISQNDQDKAVRTGDLLVVSACLSVDSVTTVFCVVRSSSGSYGTTKNELSVVRVWSDATQTNYIITSLAWRTPNSREPDKVFEKNVYPRIYYWQ